MAGRTSAAMEQAEKLVKEGMLILRAAAAAGVDASALRRHLRKIGEPPRPSPKGPRGPRQSKA